MYNCRQVIRLASRSSGVRDRGKKKKKTWITVASSRPVQPSGKSSLCSPMLSTPLKHGVGGLVCVVARGNAIAKMHCYTQD